MMAIEKLVTIIIMLALLIIIILFVVSTTKDVTPEDDINKYRLCAEWMKKKCGVMESAYLTDLVAADLCEPCEVSEADKEGKSVDQIKELMEERCGDEGDQTWTDCLRKCSCPDAPEAPEEPEVI